jgi:hypothetical protein
MGLDTKIYLLTDRQSQRDFDFDIVLSCQLSSTSEAVKIEPEQVKLKNLHVRSCYQETVDEDTAGWKRA